MNKYLLSIAVIITLTLAPGIASGQQPILCSNQQALFCDDFDNGMSPVWIQDGDCTWSVTDGQVRGSVTGYNISCSLLAQDTTWTDYTFEYDVRGNAGVDKMVLFRASSGGAYTFSIRSDWSGDEAFLHVPDQDYAQIVSLPSQNGVWYHVRIICQGNHIVINVDGAEVIDFVDTSNSCPSGGIFLICYSGGAGSCDVSFDNVVVKTIYSGPTWHIAIDGSDLIGDGSILKPFASIQTGIDAAVSGDTVLVGSGTYTQSFDFIGKAIVVKSEFGADSVMFTSPTPIGTLVSFHSGEDTLSVLDGFTFANIVTTGTNIGTGLISLQGSSGTIKNCRFTNNSSILSSEIMSFIIYQIQGGFAIIEDNLFLSNDGRGGPVYVAAAQGRIRGNVFADNSAINMGGAISVAGIYGNSSYLIEGNLFLRNSAQNGSWSSSSGGGAVFLSENINTIVRNNTFVNNTDLSGGGGAIGVWYYCSGISIQKNIFVGSDGYAVANNYGSEVFLSCNDATANLPSSYSGFLSPDANSLAVDPIFCDSAAGDFHIGANSPCAPGNNDCDILIGAYGIGCASNAPSQFDLTSPANTFMPPIATKTPILQWTQSTDIDLLDTVTYDLYLALDSNFSFMNVTSGIPNNQFVVVNPLTWGTRYWWKVKATDLYGGETWSSQTFVFRTMKVGDCDASGVVSITDIVYIINYLFANGPAPIPPSAGNTNCDNRFNITDAVFLINFIFADGPPPCDG